MNEIVKERIKIAVEIVIIAIIIVGALYLAKESIKSQNEAKDFCREKGLEWTSIWSNTIDCLTSDGDIKHFSYNQLQGGYKP